MSNPAPSETQLETTLMIARMHRKVINHYNWMLDRLTMPEAERSAIQAADSGIGTRIGRNWPPRRSAHVKIHPHRQHPRLRPRKKSAPVNPSPALTIEVTRSPREDCFRAPFPRSYRLPLARP